MSQKSGRPSKNDGRDRRMFASICSSLGVPPGQNSRRQRVNRNTEFSFGSLSDALNELTKALESPSTSLLELESYLRERGDKFTTEECTQIAARLMEYTMKSGEFSYLLGICVGYHTRLIEALAGEFLVLAAGYFTSEGNDQSVPELFGHVVASRWPPGKGRAVETVNPVLHVVMNVVMSWISVMNACGHQTKEKSLSSKMDEINLSEAEDEEEKEKREDEETKNEKEETGSEESEEYDEKAVTLSALAICTVCNVSQRNFWLNFMETFDQIFVATKNLLILGDNRCSPKVRESLLQLYVSLFKWSATGQPKRSAVSTQT